jgi:cytochrome c
MYGTVNAAHSEGSVSPHGTAEVKKLMKDRGYHCLECHDVDKRVFGPSWREVAIKRDGHKWAHELIAYQISAGSVVEYGTAEMPHNDVNEEDVDIIVDWIMSLSGSAPFVAVESMIPRH